MKNLILSAVMLTGVVAMAQEQPKQAEKQPTPVTAPAAPVKEATTEATKAQPATEKQKQTAPVKKEAVVTEKKAEAKKAEPAKKSN